MIFSRQRRFTYCCLASISILVVLHVVCDINLTSVLGYDKCNPELNGGRHFDRGFLVAEPGTCFEEEGATVHPRPVFLLVLIASAVGNFERRQAIRETWGSPKQIMEKTVVTVFLLGEDDVASGSFSPDTRDLLQSEDATHHDVIQADFLDTYKNLTVKTIIGMKWIHMYCPHASYFMKTDDDMYINYANIIKSLTSPLTPTKAFAMGHLFPKSLVIRIIFFKFYMPRCMYPEMFYPPYFAGSGYVMSGDLAGQIYKTASKVNFIYFEDVFVGVCLKALGVKPVGHGGFYYTHVDYEFCKYRNDVITSHGVETNEVYNIWQDIQHSKTVCSK
ncbi:beta-1,3-galactosyltransferase 1-like [Asterias amurensis]|uniref:beta-1,3-galactosyltransferase 1-like n=1 Tax=Asterias amurensis TaxID=7602 RepID=UPI003AB5A893